jgi:hypothetical protein
MLARTMHFALVLLLATAVAEAGDATATLLDGSSAAGQLTAWDKSQIVMETPEGEREIPLEQLLDLQLAGPAAESKPTTGLELIDGTRIRIEQFTAVDRKAVVESPYAKESLEVSTEMIRRAELQPPSDALAALWKQLESREIAGDVLIVSKRDGGLLDYLAGVIGDVSAEEVAFEYDGQKLPVKRAKVAAIAYYHAQERELRPPVCILTLADGSRIPAAAVALDGDRLRLRTPADVRLEAPLADLRRADFSAGKLAYLSDLEPLESKWVPRIAAPGATMIAGYGRPRNDISFSGSALTLAWPDESNPTGHDVRTYAKGLAVRSRTDLIYRLPDGMRRFTAVAGIDPAAAEQGHVVLEIRADDRVVWEDEIDGKRPPVEIDVDLGTARRLQFHVDYGRNLDYGDRLHLVEARLTK